MPSSNLGKVSTARLVEIPKYEYTQLYDLQILWWLVLDVFVTKSLSMQPVTLTGFVLDLNKEVWTLISHASLRELSQYKRDMIMNSFMVSKYPFAAVVSIEL